MKRLYFGREEEEPEVDGAVVMAQEVMMMLARSGVVVVAAAAAAAAAGGSSSPEAAAPRPGRVFECTTCGRRFPSFQALGGHRASHKRPRGGAAAAATALALAPAPAKRHECAVCGVEFALGQALGGHMRLHRGAGAEEKKPGEARGLLLGLDLNTAPSEDSVGFAGPLDGLNQGLVDCLQLL